MTNWPHRLALFALLLLAVTRPLHAAETPDAVATRLRAAALTDPTALDVVTRLTTEIGPRLAGSEAETRAAAWAKAEMERLGFDKVWTETFPIPRGWARGVERAEIVSPAPQPLVVTALGYSTATPPEGIEAEAVVLPSYEALLAAPPGSLAGKIAVVTQATVRAQDGAGYGHSVKIRGYGPGEAARRGAVAYLHRSLSTTSKRLAHTGVTRFRDLPRLPAAALSVPDAEQIDRLAAAGKVIRLRLVLTPRDLGPVTSQNVIGEVRGRERPEEIVLLGAHLDSWDLGTGALDDGVGVAMVMAVAKLIRELPQRPRRTLRVVLYGAEEIDLVGAAAYAAAHKDELARHVIVAEPDAGHGPVYQFQTGVADPEEASVKRMRAALEPLGVVPGDNASKGNSDVTPLVQAGVPAVSLRLDGSEYMDHHHSADDTLDKVDPRKLSQSTAAYAVFAYLAAELGADYRAAGPPAPTPAAAH